MIAEPTKTPIRSRRRVGMGLGSGCRERTHKNKAFIFSQIGHLHRQRTHSEYHFCYQLFAAILSPISANFGWIASSDCRFAGRSAFIVGGEITQRSAMPRMVFLLKPESCRKYKSTGGVLTTANTDWLARLRHGRGRVKGAMESGGGDQGCQLDKEFGRLASWRRRA